MAKVGRPLKYKTPEDMQAVIDSYFASCHEGGDITQPQVKPYTITGLALALDLTRKSLIYYEGKPEYVNTVTRAKMRVELFCEERLHTAHSAQGTIFALKNFGWADKTEIANAEKETFKVTHDNGNLDDTLAELLRLAKASDDSNAIE